MKLASLTLRARPTAVSRLNRSEGVAQDSGRQSGHALVRAGSQGTHGLTVTKANTTGVARRWRSNYLLLSVGGCKQSRYGREQGAESIEAFTQTKSVLLGLRFGHGMALGSALAWAFGNNGQMKEAGNESIAWRITTG